MYSSLHLSDLSTGSIILPPGKADKSSVLHNSIGTFHSQVFEVQMRTTKVNQYSSRLTLFERKLNSEKKKIQYSKKETINKLNDETNSIDQKVNELQQMFEKIRKKREKMEVSIAEMKLVLLEREAEMKRLLKNSDWADSTFAFRKSENKASDEFLSYQNQIDKLNRKIKNSRQQIYLYQKEITAINKTIIPVKSREHALKTRIDDLNANYLNFTVLDIENKRTTSSSIEMQKYSYIKAMLQRRIQEMQNDIIHLGEEKHLVLEKILGLKSTVNDSVLISIKEQANQLRDATKRKIILFEEKIKISYSSISKELEIAIERDSVRENYEDVNHQLEEIKTVVTEKEKEIMRLENEIASSDESIVVDETSDVLDNLIKQISEQRHCFPLLCQQVVKETTIDENDLEKEKEKTENNLSRLQLSLENEQKQIESKKNEIKLEEDRIHKEINNNNDSDIKSENHFVPNNKNYPLLNQKIQTIKKEIAHVKAKIEKKTNRVQKIKNEIDDVFSRLDLEKNKPILMNNVSERIERSIEWLYKATIKQIRLWKNIQIPSAQPMNEWDSKILAASISEADDLSIRYQILN